MGGQQIAGEDFIHAAHHFIPFLLWHYRSCGNRAGAAFAKGEIMDWNIFMGSVKQVQRHGVSYDFRWRIGRSRSR